MRPSHKGWRVSEQEPPAEGEKRPGRAPDGGSGRPELSRVGGGTRENGHKGGGRGGNVEANWGLLYHFLKTRYG